MSKPTRISTSIIKKILAVTLPEDYTKDDIDYAQLQYITSESFCLSKLIEAYPLCHTLIEETLGMVFDTPELAGFAIPPFQPLLKIIRTGDLDRMSLVEIICETRDEVYINILYSIAFDYEEKSHSTYFSDLSLVLGFKKSWKYLENKALWGLSRPRTGFMTPKDIDAITKLKKGGFTMKSLNDDYPFVFQAAFSFISGFEPTPPLRNSDIIQIANTINQLYDCLFPLLSNQKIKENFCSLISNAYSQDRTKLKFDVEANCTDTFCYTSLHLLLKIGRGIFHSSFISKIGEKKFPTFCFFYIARLIEISTYRLTCDIRENYNSENSRILLMVGTDLLQAYLNFVYDLIVERKSEVFSQIYDFYSNMAIRTNDGNADPSQGAAENNDTPKEASSNSSFPLPLRFEDFPGMLEYSFQQKLATDVSEILSDCSFLTAIFTIQSVLSCNRISSSSTFLITSIFGYKNPFKTNCLYILERSSPVISSVLAKRLLLHYSNKMEYNIYNDRFIIHELLKSYEIDVSTDSLRAISFALGSFDEMLSDIFDSITKINLYKEKETWLKGITQECELSEDEEQISLIPQTLLLILSNMTNAQRISFIRRQTGIENNESVLKDIDDQLKAQNNPFLMKLYKKTKVNMSRIDKYEKSLRSSAVYLESLLTFLQNFTKINKKLFLNKNVFSRLVSIINSSFNMLVGERSHKIRLPNKENYAFHPKKILGLVLLIITNILKGNAKLIQVSGISNDLLLKAIKLCKSRNLLMEEQIEEAEKIQVILENIKPEEFIVDDSIPDDFLDPLMFTIMKNPVTMLTSKITIDRSTFNQIMLNDRIDPFSRLPLDGSKVVENVELKKKIDEFMSKR
ncbi:Ubiquitin conjugation factor E4 [Glugoides intestinalis]